MAKTEFHFWTIDKYKQEEAWLNDLAAHGKALVKQDMGVIYKFEPCEKGEWQYKILYTENMPNDEKTKDFEQFLAENGIEQVGRFHLWAYYRKKNDGTPFQLYNSPKDEIKMMDRVLQLSNILSVVMSFDLFMMLVLGLANGFLEHIGTIGFVAVVFVFIHGIRVNLKNQLELLKQDEDLYE